MSKSPRIYVLVTVQQVLHKLYRFITQQLHAKTTRVAPFTLQQHIEFYVASVFRSFFLSEKTSNNESCEQVQVRYNSNNNCKIHKVTNFMLYTTNITSLCLCMNVCVMQVPIHKSVNYGPFITPCTNILQFSKCSRCRLFCICVFNSIEYVYEAKKEVECNNVLWSVNEVKMMYDGDKESKYFITMRRLLL